MGGALEITIEKEEADGWQNEYYVHYGIAVVRIGPKIVIETTYATENDTIKDWLHTMRREHRRLRGRTPIVVGLAAFRGRYGNKYWHINGPRSHPNHPSNPYCAIALCFGGSHVLFCNPNTPKIPALCDFLGDSKVRVVGIGIKDMAAKLEEQLGIRVAWPVEVRAAAGRAFGREAVWEAKSIKKRVVIEGLALEELAEMVLGGMRLEKKPEKLIEINWGHWMTTEEEIMWATRDAFLHFEIGFKCLKKLGFPKS